MDPRESGHAAGEGGRVVPPILSSVPPVERPVFWQEIYWFTVISLLGFSLALWVLPPRLARNRSALGIEEDLEGAVAALESTGRKYEAAIAAVENDPFYREEVSRSLLKVKKKDEEFLKAPGGVSDN
jgi:hypothetical protein